MALWIFVTGTRKDLLLLLLLLLLLFLLLLLSDLKLLLDHVERIVNSFGAHSRRGPVDEQLGRFDHCSFYSGKYDPLERSHHRVEPKLAARLWADLNQSRTQAFVHGEKRPSLIHMV